MIFYNVNYKSLVFLYTFEQTYRTIVSEQFNN